MRSSFACLPRGVTAPVIVSATRRDVHGGASPAAAAGADGSRTTMRRHERARSTAPLAALPPPQLGAQPLHAPPRRPPSAPRCPRSRCPSRALGRAQRRAGARARPRPSGCAARQALQVLAGNAPCARSMRRWPPSTAATSSASGPASWATAARCCWARSTRPLGPHGDAAQGQRPARPTRAWATAAPCCARRSASSCAPRRWRAGHPDHARAGGDRLAAAGAARDDRDRRGGDARGAELHALRPLRALRAHGQRPAELRAAGRLRDRALLSRLPRRGRSRCAALLERGGAPHRAADGAVAGGGLLPRRDEHRQHVDPRPDDRLRAVRLPRRLRPGHICNHSDDQGRYAYARQPGIAWWNLHAWRRRCCR